MEKLRGLKAAGHMFWINHFTMNQQQVMVGIKSSWVEWQIVSSYKSQLYWHYLHFPFFDWQAAGVQRDLDPLRNDGTQHRLADVLHPHWCKAFGVRTQNIHQVMWLIYELYGKDQDLLKTAIL